MEHIASFVPDRLKALSATTLSDELESSRIVHFPECPIPLPSAEELDFLRHEVTAFLCKKNVSYHAQSDKIYGLARKSPVAQRATRILKDHLARVREFLAAAIPTLTPGWTVGSSSFRPMEERGREISMRASSERVHVDAGAYGATHGNRILRFFVNANPTEERVWITKGSFEEVHRRYARVAGLKGGPALEEGWGDRLLSGLIGGISRLMWPSLRTIDTSPYDRVMRRFHNWMKETPEFQATPEGHRQITFKPFSAWMVFTDGLSHACTSGRYAFIDTFIIPLRNCRWPERAPFHILRSAV